VLQRLAASKHRPLLVITPPDRPRGRGRSVSASPLAELARSEGLELLQPADPHAPDVLAELRRLELDLLVVASYGVILKSDLLELTPHGCLNVHASLLPRFRGASPIQAAILAGDSETGVTIQRIVQELDAGDVLLARRLATPPSATSGELLELLAELGGDALVEALDLIEDGRAEYTPQDHAAATFARKLKKKHGRIDWSRPAAELERRVRAFSPWPGATFLDAKGRAVTVGSAALADAPAGAPGTVLEAGERFVVAAGEGALELLRVAPAGKREMTGPEYLRGARLEVGAVLPLPEEG
jgi:methionyl-tRNA formyltransferase